MLPSSVLKLELTSLGRIIIATPCLPTVSSPPTRAVTINAMLFSLVWAFTMIFEFVLHGIIGTPRLV